MDCVILDFNVKNICMSVHLCIYLFEMFVQVSVLILLMFFNISFQYIKIHHIYTKTLHRNAYILTI